MKLYNAEHKCLHSKSHFILSPITFDDLHAVLTLFLSGVGVFFLSFFQDLLNFHSLEPLLKRLFLKSFETNNLAQIDR